MALTNLEFDRQWASEIVDRAVIALRDKYIKRGRESWFEALRAALPGGGDLESYEDLASRLESTEGAMRKAVHDLRRSFAASLRDEIRATVRTNEDAEEELRYLVSVMAGE